MTIFHSFDYIIKQIALFNLQCEVFDSQRHIVKYKYMNSRFNFTYKYTRYQLRMNKVDRKEKVYY